MIKKSTIDLIKGFEGVRHSAYKDVAGLYTTGCGHLIKPSEPDLLKKILADHEIDQILTHDLERFDLAISEMVKVKLAQNQYDSLMSFVFNLGERALFMSSLLKTINAGIPVVEHYFTDWSKAAVGGHLVVVPGIFNRRKKEYQLFIS